MRWLGDGEGAPFDEAAGIDQVVEVLARRALVGLAPPRHRVGPLLVERQRAALEVFGEIGADVIEVDLLLDRRARHLDVGLLDEQQRVTLVDRLARLDGDAPHVAARRAADLVLHLHGVHDQQRLAGRHGIALLHREADDRALHRRRHRHGALRRIGRPPARPRWRRLAERQHGQRIDGIDPGAGLACRRGRAPPPGNRGRRCSLARRRDQLPGMLVDEARVDACRRARRHGPAGRAGRRCCVGAPSSRKAASARSARASASPKSGDGV